MTKTQTYRPITKILAISAIIVGLCGLFTAPAQAKRIQNSAKVFNAEHYTLDNGLEIVVIPNHRAPVITHMMWYKVGSGDEKPGESGLAHFLEHLMFKGSLGFKSGEFSKTIKALGGQDNAFTSRDYTAYYQSVAAKHLELVMRMEAGRMRGLNPPIEHVNSEREVVREERRQRIGNNPHGRFNEAINAALYINHPYSHPVIGWKQEIPGLTWDAAKAFYDKHYGPNNAILVVSGDVTGDQVHELAKDVYGKIPAIKRPTRHWPSIPTITANTDVEMQDAQTRQPVIQISLNAPNMRKNLNKAHALQILEEIMGTGSTSRLYKALVIDQKIASQAGMSYHGNSWGPGNITFYAYPLPEKSSQDVKAALMKEIERLISDGLTPQEVDNAKTRLIDRAVFARDSLSGPAMIIGRALSTGSKINDIETWPQSIKKVKKSFIEQTAKDTLDLKTTRYVYSRLLPKTPVKTEDYEK